MPKSNRTITSPMRAALLECFQAATRLVRPDLRHQMILVGGAASIAHSSGARSGGPFSLESDGKIAFDAPQGFRIRIDLIEIGGGCIDVIHATTPFLGGSLASKSDLLRLRAKTVVERGSDGEVDDFRWLLRGVARERQVLPLLDDGEVEDVVGAGGCLDILDRLLLVAVLGAENGAAGFRLLLPPLPPPLS
ncbi:hypothetical protein LY78DRAFT_706648 [Colletotrichum sublineola]|nr:hypothetical protein LY78DRAFT_706648 [Colletotrichum sublineola]